MKALKIGILFLIIVSLGLFVSATDLTQVTHALAGIGFRFLYLILITFHAYLFATIGWKYCMGKPGEALSVKDLFLIRHIGEMVSIVNPTSVIGGEAAKVYLLQNRGVEKTTVIASVLISRIMMAVTQLLLFFVTLAFLILHDQNFSYRLPSVSLTCSGLLLGILALLICLQSGTHLRKWLKGSAISRLMHTLNDRLKLQQVLSEFLFFFKTDKKGLLCCTFFFSLHWVAGSLEIYCILKLLGISTGVVQVLFADMGIIIFKAAGAFVPGQIGVEEFGNKVMLDLIGLPQEGVWITVSVLRRSRQLFWILFGFAAYLIYYKKAKTLPGTT